MDVITFVDVIAFVDVTQVSPVCCLNVSPSVLLMKVILVHALCIQESEQQFVTSLLSVFMCLMPNIRTLVEQIHLPSWTVC